MFEDPIDCAVSLTLPLMAVTGPLIWWNRQRRRASSAAQAGSQRRA